MALSPSESPQTPLAADALSVANARRLDRAVALWLGLALFLFYLMTGSGREPYGDESHYVRMAWNILFLGLPKAIHETVEEDSAKSGALGSDKLPLGQSFLTVPFVAADMAWRGAFPHAPLLFLRIVVNVLPAGECAAACALLFLLVRMGGEAAPELRVSRHVAALVALAAGLGTQLWPSASALFGDTSAMFLLTLAIWVLARLRIQGGRARGFVIAAAAAAMACLCKNLFAVACPALAMYGLWELRRRRRRGLSRARMATLVILVAIPFVLAAAIQLWHNRARYGSIWLSGYHNEGFTTPLLIGLYGVFFSTGRSLFLYSPPCLLALWGVWRFARHLPGEAALAGGACLPALLLFAKWHCWGGGWEWGLRFYLFLIPPLMWASAPAWQWLDRRGAPKPARWLRGAALGVLLVSSLFMQSLGVLINPTTFYLMHADDFALREKRIPQIHPGACLFIPECSPAATHAWLIWATWNRSRLGNDELLARCPYRTPFLADAGRYLGYDPWLMSEWQAPGGAKGLASAIALLLAAACAGCVWRVIVLLRRLEAERPGFFNALPGAGRS